jgi:hypothetical protein
VESGIGKSEKNKIYECGIKKGGEHRREGGFWIAEGGKIAGFGFKR